MGDIEDRHWWFTVRRRMIVEAIARRVQGPQKILDVGCGTGALSAALQSMGEVLAVDSEPLALARTQSRGITTAPLEEISANPRAEFDVVCLFDVLEHIEDDEKALAHWVSHVKPGGLVAITVPAFMIFWGGHDVASGHHRRYNKKSLLKLMSTCGIVPLETSYFNFILSPLVLGSRILERITGHQAAHGDLYLPPPAVNRALELLFSAEIPFVRRHRAPFGVSLLALGRRP